MNKQEILEKIDVLSKELICYKLEIESLREELQNIENKPFPELKSGYRVTWRNGDVLMVVEVNTNYYSGLYLVNPKNNAFSDVNNYNGNKSKTYEGYDIVKVEKLTHPYSIFYSYKEEDKTKVLWEE